MADVVWFEKSTDVVPEVTDKVMTYDGTTTQTATISSLLALYQASKSANIQSILNSANYAAVRTLLGIEAGATADQTAAEIEALLDTYFGSTAWRTESAPVQKVVESLSTQFPEYVIILGGATPPTQGQIDTLVSWGVKVNNILYAET